MRLGLAIVRVVVGLFFMGHGAQKLFGWFGGHGPEGTGRFFESVGLRPGRRQAIRAGEAEMAGGALLAAGLLTPAAAGLITSVMVGAIRSVHLGRGPWASDGGWEYNATVIALMYLVAESGPGGLSLDALLGIEASGPAVAATAVAAGAAAALLMGAPEPEEQESAPDEGAAA